MKKQLHPINWGSNKDGRIDISEIDHYNTLYSNMRGFNDKEYDNWIKTTNVDNYKQELEEYARKIGVKL